MSVRSRPESRAAEPTTYVMQVQAANGGCGACGGFHRRGGSLRSEREIDVYLDTEHD
jgi:hypothetical protein